MYFATIDVRNQRCWNGNRLLTRVNYDVKDPSCGEIYHNITDVTCSAVVQGTDVFANQAFTPTNMTELPSCRDAT
jgi:hypothetical protein